jgi:hypothetical protein
MSDMTDPDALQPIIRTCQIIVGALIMGVMTFLAIVLFAIPPLLNPAPAFPGEGAGGGRDCRAGQFVAVGDLLSCRRRGPHGPGPFVRRPQDER